MKRLIDLAAVLRSKNAGPLWLTLDVMFSDEATYRMVLRSGSLTKEAVARLYGVRAENVQIIPYEIVQSIKVTLPRRCVSGDVTDTDIYGCQQHIPLANLPIAEETL